MTKTNLNLETVLWSAFMPNIYHFNYRSIGQFWSLEVKHFAECQTFDHEFKNSFKTFSLYYSLFYFCPRYSVILQLRSNYKLFQFKTVDTLLYTNYINFIFQMIWQYVNKCSDCSSDFKAMSNEKESQKQSLFESLIVNRLADNWRSDAISRPKIRCLAIASNQQSIFDIKS